MDSQISWDSLRKQNHLSFDPQSKDYGFDIEITISDVFGCLPVQARKLEAQLDEQMSFYHRLVATKADGSESDLESGIEYRPATEGTSVSNFTYASVGIIRGLRNFFSYIDLASRNSTRPYLEPKIFEVQEFHRLRSSLGAKQEHASLLQDFREFDRARVDLEENGGFEGQALLKEQAAMDTVISQAQATLGHLVLQRSTFSGISSKITNVSSRLPSVNHILSAIKKKKSMDTIILSLVASVCTFLILIYWLTK